MANPVPLLDHSWSVALALMLSLNYERPFGRGNQPTWFGSIPVPRWQRQKGPVMTPKAANPGTGCLM